jgi:hypothetical protein
LERPEPVADELGAYEAGMRLMSVPYERLSVSTRFGRTRVVASGLKGSPSLVLLHAGGATLERWSLEDLATLSCNYSVYVIDVIVQSGTRTSDEPIRSQSDHAAWLTDTLDALAVGRAHLVNTSCQGWVALVRDEADLLHWLRSLPGVCFVVSDTLTTATATRPQTR